MKYEKLSAGMSALFEEYVTRGTPAMASMERAVPLAEADPASAPKVFAYIRCDTDADLDDLPDVDIHSRRGRIRTALISLDGLDSLTEDERVYRVSPSIPLKPLNDIAAAKTNLSAFKTAANPNLSGREVIVGIVDSGIDSTHSAFSGRIHSVWDQTITGTGWGNTNYGTVLTPPNLHISLDINGHGTHVAGTAAGDDPAFGGVAHAADIVIVKTSFLNTAIGDGIRYIFHVAEAEGKAAVVNLSLGGHFDAHDGSDDLSDLIDSESGPGRIVVAAAGNESGDNIHAEVDLPAGQSAAIPLLVPPNIQSGATPWVVLNGWYDGASGCEISIETSSGNTTPFQGVIIGANSTRIYNFANAVVKITTPPTTTTPNGDHHFRVELLPGPFAGLVQGGTWKLRIRNVSANDTTMHAWSLVPQGANDAEFQPPFNTDRVKIGSPGAAQEAITVASFTTRNQWTDIGGINRAVGLPLNDISNFSSPGPLRNGARKPDVTAPGAMIISCTSVHSSPRPGDVVTSRFRVNAGTSMACPFITGLVALMLEQNDQLDPTAIKARLQANSVIPGGHPAGTFDPKWGYGLIDCLNL